VSRADVFSKRKPSEVVPRTRGRGNRDAEPALARPLRALEFSEIELIASDAKVFDDVRDDSARHIARMPRERDQAVGTKRVGVMPVTAGGAKKFTTDFTESPVQLAAVPRGIFAHGSGSENKFVAEGRRDGASGFEQRFQVDLGGLLKAQRCLAAVASVRVAAGQERRFGNPHAVFILTKSHFREWNNHGAATLTRSASGVKGGR